MPDALPQDAQAPENIHSDSSHTGRHQASQVPELTRHRPPLYALTGLRFFAASQVVLFHTRLSAMLLDHGYPHAARFIANGNLAVTLFFMLSGFILGYNYNGQVNGREDAFRFWEARFARIWPAYAFSLLCMSVMSRSNIPTLPLALATIAMVQAWNPMHPEYAGAWNFVCWSLSVEAFFYLVFPLLQRFVQKLRVSQMLGLGLCIALFCVVSNAPLHTLGLVYSGPMSYIPYPLIHLPAFIGGVLIGNIFLHRQTHLASLKDSENSLNCGGTATVEAQDSNSANTRFKFPYWTVFGAAASVLVLATANNNMEGVTVPAFAIMLYGLASERTLLARFLSSPLPILGGEISYSMYLLRPPLQTWLFAYPAFHNNKLIDLLYIPLGVIPLSIFSFYVVEGPSRRFLRRFFATVQGRPAHK